MAITCGLENQAYKYVYGVYNRWIPPFDPDKEMHITCGKNDWSAVQLLLYSEKDMMVCVNEDSCFYERGPIDIVRVMVDVPGIDRNDIDVKLIGLIKDDDRQEKSDVLLDTPFIYVQSRKVQPVWIEIKISKEMKPGVYKPQIKVFSRQMFEDEKLIRTLNYTINVVDVTINDEKSFYLDLWQHNSNIARKYDLSLWSGKHFEIMENYIKTMADLGQKSISVVVSDIPWSGQNSAYIATSPSNMFEYSIVRIVLNKNGEWQYDFSSLNRYIKLCMKYGIDQEIEVFGLINIWVNEDAGYSKVIEDYDDGIRIRYFDEASGTYRYMKRKSQLADYIKKLEQNFIENGWIEKVRILGDEPSDLEILKNRLREIKSMAPSFQFKICINNVSVMEENLPGVVDYVPKLMCICHDYDRAMRIKEDIDGKLLFYLSCWSKTPNTFICSPLIESRIIPWLTLYMKFDGFLRWAYTAWPDDPLEEISYRYPRWPAGDTCFVYPGKDGKPLLSLRYKNLQRGIRDYEIFQAYIRQNGKEALNDRMRKVFYWETNSVFHPDSKKKAEDLYALDYESYEQITGNILNDLQKDR